MLAKHWNEKIPVNVLDWLRKWEPVIDLWISSEGKAHLFLHDGETHDWKKIILEMAENMRDVRIAHDEMKAFPQPESPECEDVIQLVRNGIEHIEKIVHLSRTENFEGLLNE